MKGTETWLYPFLLRAYPEMDDLKALGQVLRELRVGANLTREACAGVMSRDHLARVEQGQQALTVGKLQALCDVLGIAISQLFFAVEARRRSVEMQPYRKEWNEQLDQLIEAGRLCDHAQEHMVRGVRGKRADETSVAVRELQAQGMRKMQVVRKLGIGRTTVDRYWAQD